MAFLAGCIFTRTARPAGGSASAGQMVALSVDADGTPPFAYQWYKDGAPLAGATARDYVIISAQTSDAGTYRVTVSNSYGATTSDDAVLAVTAPSSAPEIMTLPTEAATEGESITFAVAASGSSYQWQRQPAGSSTWQDLAESDAYSGVTTPVLTVNSADSAMSGDQFRCVTTGPGGSTTSRSVSLTVGGNVILLQYPAGIARDSAGNLYVADASSNTIQKVTSGGVVTVLAGTAGAVGSSDGTGADARFNQPAGVAVDAAGYVYVADSGNATIRKISPEGTVTTLAGSPANRGSQDGAGSAATFSQPAGLAVDKSGTVFVADAFNATIRKVGLGGTVSTVAGTVGSRGEADGNGPAARFNFPSALAVDDAGDLFVADTYNATIRKIGPDGTVTTLAGSAGITGAVDLTGVNALFDLPFGLAVDAAGNVYIADTGNSTIRKIAPGGAVTTLAGTAGIAGLADGAGGHALFNQPHGLVIDGAGGLYVADAGNAAIRRVAPDGTVTTMTLTPPAPVVPPVSSGSPPPPATGGDVPAFAGGGGGGGGAMGGWWMAAMLLLSAARCAVRRR